jgi:hypothetical protein
MSSFRSPKEDLGDVKPVVIAIDDTSKAAISITIDEATNKRLLRKIDWRLMPVVSNPGMHCLSVIFANRTISFASLMPYNTMTRPL